ncbi:MAG: HAMP domain-containing histidine kinase [bacterium]|nr:HAMP domain-containing histidine kinase [bacterium]
MRKIVRQQNYLKELIDFQANKYLSKYSLKCLIRSAIEPLLDEPMEGVVLYRLEKDFGLQGLIQRLEFSEITTLSYSDESDNLLEKVWANTEFVCVMTHRYVSILVWDNRTGDDNSVRYYSLYNSKFQDEALDIISRNSKADISEYKERFRPDRRDNKLLNMSFRKLLNDMDEAIEEAVLGYAERSVEVRDDIGYERKKTRISAHEIRNQLSICDLYTEIIRKNAQNGNTDGVLASLSAISKAVKMANNTLLSLKSDENGEFETVLLSEVIDNALELSKVYAEGKDIDIQIENNAEVNVDIDFDKMTAVLINLVKNATESFQTENSENDINGKYIKIKTEQNGDEVSISVSNNGYGISEPEKIFKDGFTTKSSGSGLGLWICKKSIEEMSGTLELTRSTEDYTEFTIVLKVVD